MAADDAGEDSDVRAIAGGAGTEDEDVVDVGSSSRALRWFMPSRGGPNWRWRIAGVLLLIVVAASYLAVHRLRHQAAMPVNSPPAPATSAAKLAQADDEDGLAAIAAMAQGSGASANYVRATSARDSCRLAPTGSSGRQSIAGAIHRHIAGYVVQDSGRVLDQFTALCSATVRARDKAGSVLVVYVVAPGRPAPRPHWQIAATTLASGEAVVCLLRIAPGGWQIMVGTVGPVADEPRDSTLLRLAEDPALLW